MAYSTIPKVRRDGLITLKDGTAIAVTLDVTYEEGNLTIDNLNDLRDQTVIRDRGEIVAVRKADQQPLTGSFSFYFREFTDAAVGGIRDFITGSNAYSANTSTGTTGSPYVEHYCFDLVYTVEGTNFDSAADHVATLSKCVGNLSLSEGDPSTYSLSFTCYGGISFTGPT